MKTSFLIPAAAFILINLNVAAQPSIGGFNVYYGHLHNHCNISDGVQTPDYAYNYAKTTGDLDFFSLSDHSSAISSLEWTAMKTAADKYNEANIFTAFAGFEWTDTYLGHVAVINSTNYITTATPYNTFTGLCTWLNSNECVAFFNHPGRNNSTGLEFSHFTTTPTEKIVGMELWNKTDKFPIYYYTDGYYTGDGNLSWYDEALKRGWKIGASGSEDNHSGTWGTMAASKLAVLSPANNRTEIMNALKAKRFFTTYDKNLALSFKINGNEMGSTVIAGSYKVEIQASDADNEVFKQIQLLRNGVVINTMTLNIANPAILLNLNCYDGEYYYVRVIQEDNDEAISSPIQISGGSANIPPIVALTSPANGFSLPEPATITMSATASDPDGSITKVEFYQGTTLLGEDLVSPYNFSISGLTAGTYNLTAKATDNSGASTTSGVVTITVTAPTPTSYIFTKRITAGSEDVEEYSSGTMTLTSSALELVYASKSTGNQIVGLRFTSVTIPKGAIVTKAYIQFGVSQKTTATCKLTIKGEYSGTSAAFTTSKKNVSNRTKTIANVAWSPTGWSTTGAVGTSQQTPDLKTIVQEITSHAGWIAGNSMAFIITGTGTRTAYAYEGSSSKAAQLYVEYTYTGGKSGMIASGQESDNLVLKNPLLENKLICYPVPFNDQLHINIITEKEENVQSIRLLNSNGILVRDLNPLFLQTTVNSAGLAQGIYFIQVRTNLAFYRKSIVKI
ncbi:MAG: CehA/McbA family metallohydrolase [Bacteroidia bacterium]|nr:CehA/McbA family metallohydrolase [Bacteroidia bacterium]